MEFPVPVEVEQLACDYLNGHADVLAVLRGRAHDTVPRNPVAPFVVVDRFGGTPTRQGWLDAPHVQFDVWGESKRKVKEVAAVVYTAMLDFPGTYDTAIVTAVEDILGFRSVPDPVTRKPRIIFQLRVTLHPIAA